MTQFKPSDNFWLAPDTFRDVWTNKQWREYILSAGLRTMAQCYSYNWKSKPIGGGLREVWLERRRP